MARRAGKGAPVKLVVYPGAHHSFDNVGRALTWLPNVDNGAGCRPRSASILGPLLNERELTGCVHKGATLGWHPAATEQARRNVVGQLAGLMN
jgi:acetyl esterase/lipase